MAKFIEDVNALSDLDGGQVLDRAIAIGLGPDVETLNRLQGFADSWPLRTGESIMAAQSAAGFHLRMNALTYAERVEAVPPDSPDAKRVGGAWVEAVGAFKTRDAVDWDGHPAAHLAAPDCAFVPVGWAEFGPFVPWLVCAGYSPQNAPRKMGPFAATEAVRLVTAAMAGWDAGVDESAQWWSDGWYQGVGIGPDGASRFRAAGWEPPLAAFMVRWGGRVQAKTLTSRFKDVPVSVLRKVWRGGLRGSDMGPGFVQSAPQSVLTDLVKGIGPVETLAWLDRFGSVASAGRVLRWGLTPDLLTEVDQVWPDHDLFRFMDGMPDRQVDAARPAGWLSVSLATRSLGQRLPPEAHVSAARAFPGWVPDFLDAGITDPAEAMAMVDSGVDLDTLRMMSALRG